MTRRVLAALTLAAFAQSAPAQLRVVTYNTSDGDLNSGTNPFAVGTQRRAAVTAVLSAIGSESVNGIARPLDVLLLQESRGAASSGQTFVDILNGVYGAGAYARGAVNGASTGAGTHTVVYRTATVNLIDEVAVGATSTAGAARQPLRHHVRPAGYAAADLYLYNAHWKSGTTTSDASRRAVEAAFTRADADALGAGVRAVYAGDFNLQGPGEQGYQNLLAAGGAGRAIDPVFSGSSWANTRVLHSQSPVRDPFPTDPDAYPGQALGGMDDRYDFLLPTANMDPATGRGIRQLAGSYRVFGNNGSHALNGRLDSGSQPAAVLQALRQTSEHLPVVTDYTVPARLTATVAVASPRVIRGQTASVSLSVGNTPPAVAGPSAFVAAGVDPLDYTYSRTGAVAGGGSATGLVAFTSNGHTLTVPTSAAGVYSGAVTATATSAQAANPFGSANVSVTALGPSAGSFDNAALTTSQAVQFGTVTVGQSSTRQLAVFNLVGPNGAGLTADLRYLGVGEGTAGGPLTASLAPTSPDLQPGVGNWTLTLSANSAVTGTFSDTFTLSLSDEAIPGATGQTLTVQVEATFVPVPEPGSVTFLLAAAGAVGYARRRGSLKLRQVI